jgi:uncharacterized membrane protein
MNPTQIATTFAPIVTFFAGLLAGKGVFGWDAAVWAQVLGGVIGFAGTIYAAIVTKKSSLVGAVANMPEVTTVHLDPAAPATAAIDAVTPSNVKVP